MKVILLKDYDLPEILEQWKLEKENAPAHHLWGATTLHKYGIDVEILPYEKYPILKKISQKIKIFGDLDQQLRLLNTKSQYDVVYSGHDLETGLLAFLRLFGLFKKPIVAVAHQSFTSKNLLVQFFVNFFVKGNDKILCLNSFIKDYLINNFKIDPEKIEILEWGYDLPFYQVNPDDSIYNNSENRFILTAGKTYRDYESLTKAFAEIKCSLKICGFGNSLIDNFQELPANIHIFEKVLPWRQVLEEYRQAYAVAIPLSPFYLRTRHNAVGLTSLLEAISMGKAVVMTRNKYVGIDIEKEGIGIWVEPGDIKGWQQAITYLLEHPELTKEMGNRGRRLAEERFNLELFSQKLANYLKSVV